MLCSFRISSLWRGLFLAFWICHSTSASGESASLERSLTNITQTLCAKVSDSLFINPSTTELQIANDLFPTLPLNSNFSNAVSVTTLSSSLIKGFGDSYAIAIIGVENDPTIEWQSVYPSGSALPLPDLPAPSFSSTNNSGEVQFDNRFGLFHTDAEFSLSFPTSILILAPTDRIRFKLLSEASKLSLDDCETHALHFVFFKTTSFLTKLLELTQEGPKQIVNIEKCESWPFSNTVYKICPGFQISAKNGSTTKEDFSTLLNKVTAGVTIGSVSFDEDNDLTTERSASSTPPTSLPLSESLVSNATSQTSSENPTETETSTLIQVAKKTTFGNLDKQLLTEGMPTKETEPQMANLDSEKTLPVIAVPSPNRASTPGMPTSSSSSAPSFTNPMETSVVGERTAESKTTFLSVTTPDGTKKNGDPHKASTSPLFLEIKGNTSTSKAVDLENQKSTNNKISISSTSTDEIISTSSEVPITNQGTHLSSPEGTESDGNGDVISSTIGKRSTPEPFTSKIDKAISTEISTKSLKPETTETESTFSLRSIVSPEIESTDSASTPSTSQPTLSSTRSPKICSSGVDSNLCKYCTKDPTNKQCVVSIYPQIFDLGTDDPKITVTLEATKDLDEIGKFECTLINRATLQMVEAEVETEGSAINVEFQRPNEQTEMRLTCSVDGAEFLSNRTIYLSSFESLVEHKTPFSSGFDSSVEHKTVYVTFKEALPSQFTAPGNNDAFCVLDQQSGIRFSAKLETPSVLSCEIDGSASIGNHKLYAIRRPELEAATFQFQTPLSFAVTAASTTTSPNTKTAEFLPTLNGILVTFDSTSDITDRTFNCSKVFMGSETFGTFPTCQMTGSKLTITFGASPSILPSQPLLVRSGALTNAYLDGGKADATQYDVIELKVPGNAATPSISLQEPSEAIACQQSVNLSIGMVSGDGGRNLTLHWNLKGGGSSNLASILSQASSASVQIPLSDIGTAASISVNACNFVEKCSESNVVEIKTSDKTSQFAVSIAGIPLTPLPSSKIALSAIPNFVSCNFTKDLSMTNISYEWSINGSVVSHDSIYTVPAKTYSPNSVLTVSISAKYWNEETSAFMEATSQESIIYGVENLVTIVDGTERAIASDTELIIDARQSFDPNTGSTNLSHSWSCFQSDGTNCSNLELNWNSRMLVVASGVLKPGKNYTFTDVISNSASSFAQISVNVRVLQGSVPIIQLIPLTEFSLPLDNYIRVQGYVQSKTELLTEWQLFKFPDSSIVDVSSVFSQAKRNFSENGDNSIVAVSFTIPPGNTSRFPAWKGLDPGKYTVRLVATNVAGSSFTDHIFEVLALPRKPTLSMTPMKDVSALQTMIQLSAQDIPASASNKPMSLRFGFRTLLVNNRSTEKWFRASALDYYKTILAAAWPEPHAACEERVAYEALLEICDFDGACSTTESERFVVQHPLNSSLAATHILTSAISDIASGDIEGALVKLVAIQSEQCNTSLDSVVVDALISKVLTNLENSTDSDALLAGVGVCAAVISSASKENVDKIMELLIRAQKAAVASRTPNEKQRRKRNTATYMAALAASSVSAMPETVAETLLAAYDSLLKQPNQNVMPGYIDNILNLLSNFCVQLDSTRAMTADGDGYTVIQAEGLSPVDDTFLNQSYDVAMVPKSIIFGSSFKAAYKSYPCGANEQATCTEICMASADISKKALTDNSYLQQHFFGSTYNAITFASAMSDLYYVFFVDPNSGAEITLSSGVGFNFSIPLLNYAAANYYSCFVYTSGIWRSNLCKSNDYATKIDTSYVLECYCEVTGIIAVFTVGAPTPQYYPPYNAIELNFNLSSTAACTNTQLSTFLGTLTASSGIAPERFKNYTCNNGTNLQTNPASITLQLRPPFREKHLSNSFAMQAINRAVTVGSRMVAYGKVEVTGFKSRIIFRPLKGDGRARRIRFRIEQSYNKVIGNETGAPEAMSLKWATSLSKNMQIDPQRFKNPNIVPGIVFNVTITLPFVGEKSLSDPALTAEELSLWIKEQTDFYEIDLRDNTDQQMQVDPLDQIIQLEALSPTNTLMTVLAIVLSTVFVLSSLCIGGLVFLKIRTDRLIDEHNRNIRTIQIDAISDPPMTVIPFESNGMMIDRNGLITEEMHDAADTVILGRHRRTEARVRHR